VYACKCWCFLLLIYLNLYIYKNSYQLIDEQPAAITPLIDVHMYTLYTYICISAIKLYSVQRKYGASFCPRNFAAGFLTKEINGEEGGGREGEEGRDRGG